MGRIPLVVCVCVCVCVLVCRCMCSVLRTCRCRKAPIGVDHALSCLTVQLTRNLTFGPGVVLLVCLFANRVCVQGQGSKRAAGQSNVCIYLMVFSCSVGLAAPCWFELSCASLLDESLT